MIVDLHVHTQLSSDSKIAPEKYLEFAKTRAAVSARFASPSIACFRAIPKSIGSTPNYPTITILIIKGVEADTDLGHLLLFGLNDEVMPSIRSDGTDAQERHLIEVIHKEGGIAIPAHPFRDSGYGARLDALVSRHGAAIARSRRSTARTRSRRMSARWTRR